MKNTKNVIINPKSGFNIEFQTFSEMMSDKKCNYVSDLRIKRIIKILVDKYDDIFELKTKNFWKVKALFGAQYFYSTGRDSDRDFLYLANFSYDNICHNYIFHWTIDYEGIVLCIPIVLNEMPELCGCMIDNYFISECNNNNDFRNFLISNIDILNLKKTICCDKEVYGINII